MGQMKYAIKYLMLSACLLLSSASTESCMLKGVVDRIEDMGQAVVLLETEKRQLLVNQTDFLVAEGDVLVLSCEEAERFLTHNKLSYNKKSANCESC